MPVQGIIKLEADTGALRNLLANAATLMVKLKEVAAPPPAPLAATVADEAAAASSAAGDWEQSPDGLKCAGLSGSRTAGVLACRPLRLAPSCTLCPGWQHAAVCTHCLVMLQHVKEGLCWLVCAAGLGENNGGWLAVLKNACYR